MKKLQIGNVTLDNPVILAPMAGVSDLPFRLLCREMGAALVCMEMVSAKAIYYNNKNTDSLMEIHPEEVPASLQLFGSDPQILAEMAKRIEERPFSILDLNMGCPVPKVVNNGEGSALMKDPKLVEQILTALVRAIDKPVTVKIRKGFDDDHVLKEIPHQRIAGDHAGIFQIQQIGGQANLCEVKFRSLDRTLAEVLKIGRQTEYNIACLQDGQPFSQRGRRHSDIASQTVQVDQLPDTPGQQFDENFK